MYHENISTLKLATSYGIVLFVRIRLRTVIITYTYCTQIYNNCDRIWENMHSSHIQFFDFGDS